MTTTTINNEEERKGFFFRDFRALSLKVVEASFFLEQGRSSSIEDRCRAKNRRRHRRHV